MTYTATYTAKSQRHSRVIYAGPSKTEAKRAAAAALGYRRLASAYCYASTTQDGEEGVFYCRRANAGDEDFDCACIVPSVRP